MSNMHDEELLDYSETVHTIDNKKNLKITSFNDLLLRNELIKGIKDANLEHPSDIQAITIPKAILGVDVLCQGKSGTGKTVIFVLSSLQRLSST
ncbi:ATP-dependent RNA helicase, partial [Pseudoloma neurophilia]